MKKKILSTLVAVTMISTMFMGCSSKSEGETAASSDAASSNELTVWCWDPAFNLNAMEKAEAIYQKDHPDFKLNLVETPWLDIQTKITTAASSGQLDTLPDILLMQDSAFQKNVISYPDLFADISDTTIDFSQFALGKTSFSTVDGKNYGVPFDNGAVIACYRTDVLEEAGYSTDEFTGITFNEYLEKGKDVLAKTGKPLLSCVGGESDVIVMMLQSAGGSFFDENGKPNIVNNSILKEVVNTYIELVKSGVLIEVNDWDQYIATINNGTVAGAMNGCWIMASVQAAKDQEGKWAITNMPKLDQVPTATNYANQGGSSWAIMKNSKNIDLATDFFAKTFAGSTELYDEILPSGALSTYLPAGKSSSYAQTNDFFGGKPVYTEIVSYAGKIPSTNTGVYFYEARDAVATAITNIINGSTVEKELKTAEDTVVFAMNQ